MLNKLKNGLDSLTADMSSRAAFSVGGIFAVLAVIQIILRLVRADIHSSDYTWLAIVDLILVAIFFAAGMYIRSRKK